MKPRNTYKYRLKRGNKLVPQHPYGITDDLWRRENELRREFPGSHIVKVGIRTTRKGALRWERRGGKE